MDFTELSSKGIRALDDMHTMVGYVNDLRILFIVITVTAYLGAFGFLIYKIFFAKKSKKFDEEFGNFKNQNWRELQNSQPPENESLKRKLNPQA